MSVGWRALIGYGAQRWHRPRQGEAVAAGGLSQVRPAGAAAPPARFARSARPGTMTVTRLDQGQRHRPRMAFLKKVRDEQASQAAAPLRVSAPAGPRLGGVVRSPVLRSPVLRAGGPVFIASCPALAFQGPSGCVREVTAPPSGLWGPRPVAEPCGLIGKVR